MIQIEFFGACESVTGSQHLITYNGKKILLECGLYQGRRQDMERINRTFPFDPSAIDALIVSHAHIDHSGNTPNLVKQGFQGKIFCTEATAKMLEPMLLDSAKIQTYDVEYLNKKLRDPNNILEPIYTVEDAQKVFSHISPVKYHEWFEVVPKVQCYFQDAGHILGSALVTLYLEDEGKIIKLGYTGDLGRKFLPILRDPEQIKDVDFLICESTYGDRLHNDIRSSYDELAAIINQTYSRGGKVIIPSFAVERAQELLYIIHHLKDLKKIPQVPVYLDSPLAVKIVNIFSDFVDLYDEETQDYFLKKKDNPFIFSGLHLVESTQDSKALNTNPEPCIIISASGMCEFGRIRHHLKNNIDNPKNTIAIVGYQAKDTLGRKLLDGVKEVNILDAHLKVRAQIVVFNSLSAHADQYNLIEFIKKAGDFKKLFLVHGEAQSKNILSGKLKGSITADIIIPACDESFNLS